MTWLAGHILRHRIWQLPFGPRQRAEPHASEIKHPVKADFHTVVSKAGVNVTFKPTNSTCSFVTDTPITARLGVNVTFKPTNSTSSFVTDTPITARLSGLSFLGVEHAERNTGGYDSDEVQDMAWQIASEHAPVNFGHFTS
jgi:hypothetical protein